MLGTVTGPRGVLGHLYSLGQGQCQEDQPEGTKWLFPPQL